MSDSKRIISGYEFETDEDYENAKREAESVLYIKAHTDLTDNQQVLKLYNKASDMKMFKTVIGYEFMHQLYGTLIKKKVIEEEYIKSIPVMKQKNKELPEEIEEANKRSEQYRILYENSKSNRKLQNIIIVFLIFLIGLMMVMVYFNYTTYDEEKVIDKYSSWEVELQQREDAVRAKEKQLGIQYEENEDSNIEK
ncbi:MAG: hypothetical protein II838_11550 [Lachnospiraceae bacterium]|jgi:hypothetical protein|nr:hypothetical protein [Lachnospiraceae bacterium]